MTTAWKVAAAVYGVIAVLAAIFFASTSRLPTADFDILGCSERFGMLRVSARSSS